ncbi:MAG: hypothetical protein HJJLKODD_01284 [Phycisphaerae bacterium]|nr:hypothetical protein [Phycisphaerae bacterium]
MSKRKTGKLGLFRETVRLLSNQSLGQIQGAATQLCNQQPNSQLCANKPPVNSQVCTVPFTVIYCPTSISISPPVTQQCTAPHTVFDCASSLPTANCTAPATVYNC